MNFFLLFFGLLLPQASDASAQSQCQRAGVQLRTCAAVERIARGKQIIVTSGRRSVARNRNLRGAAARSLHIGGYAIDFKIPGLSQQALIQRAMENHPGGGGEVGISRGQCNGTAIHFAVGGKDHLSTYTQCTTYLKRRQNYRAPGYCRVRAYSGRRICR